MKKNQAFHTTPKLQRGATLLVTMIMMLLITLISITALKNSTQQTKLMASVVRKDNSFQQSESLLTQHNYDNIFNLLVTLGDSFEKDRSAYIKTNNISKKLDTTSKMTIDSEARLLGTRNMATPGGVMYSAKEDSPKPYVIELHSNTKIDGSSIETTIRQGRIVVAPPLFE
jgi:Tfp pilus assembly protein PilX